jgi:hypothetical protein
MNDTVAPRNRRIAQKTSNCSVQTKGGQLAAREHFFIWPMPYFQITSYNLKFIVYRYNKCYLVLNIVKRLNVIYNMFKYSFQP